MKKIIYRISKKTIWNLHLKGLDTKDKIINYLNLTSGVKGKIVDIEVV